MQSEGVKHSALVRIHFRHFYNEREMLAVCICIPEDREGLKINFGTIQRGLNQCLYSQHLSTNQAVSPECARFLPLFLFGFTTVIKVHKRKRTCYQRGTYGDVSRDRQVKHSVKNQTMNRHIGFQLNFSSQKSESYHPSVKEKNRQEDWESLAVAAKSLQSCPTLCDPIDSSPPGSPVPGILQGRTLEWVAISFSNA